VTIEASIQSVLNNCASNGSYQDIAPQGTETPYIVWTEVVSTTNNTFEGASDLQNLRLQVDIYAKMQGTRSLVTAAVIAAMAGASFTNIQISSQNLYEAEVKLFRTILEFSVWSTG
jgi:hypothetical protein